MHEKLEVFKIFKRFRIMVEIQTEEHKVNFLRMDSGKEFTSNEFFEYCITNGINRQNGVAKRRYQMIMNMGLCMLATKAVPKEFWLKAANWDTHILNRCPTSYLQHTTPKEACNRTKPSVEHFKVFGCIVIHIPNAKRKKRDEKSSKCVFIGVSEESKGLRVYDPKTEKTIISRDVIFEEKRQWNWNNSLEKQLTQSN